MSSASGGSGGSGGTGATGGSGGMGGTGGTGGMSSGGTGGMSSGGTGGETTSSSVTPYPYVDCTKPENCYHVVCWNDPKANCGSVPAPGNCPVGQVTDITSGMCRECTADDCDGLASFCCGSPVCANSAACGLYLCKDIDAQCSGVTSATCGFQDLDSDDAWGDCDEAPSDPCCYCKIALGCIDSVCKPGNYVHAGACTPCTANDCDQISCKGLNGCATGCPPTQYFDGVRCRDCASTDSADVIPACNGGKVGP
jgi:hypothetical protein